MKKLVLTIIISLTLCVPAQAFSKKRWDSFNVEQQYFYMLGVFEGLMVDPGLREQTLYLCWYETKTTYDVLYDLVLENYESSFWKHSDQENIGVAVVLMSALEQYCVAKGYKFD
jgi:hypothetical protein